MRFQVRDLGRVGFVEAWDLQKRLVEERRNGRIPDTLLLVEHPPVVTLGARAKEATPEGFPCYRVERGGDVTYHGPGQLVGYPIVSLQDLGVGTRDYLRLLENLLIASLRTLGVEAQAVPGLTGVWAQGKKIASIGVAVKHWVCYHGFALNVDMDLRPFSAMHPCRLEPREISDLSRLLGKPVPLPDVRFMVADTFWRHWLGLPAEVREPVATG